MFAIHLQSCECCSQRFWAQLRLEIGCFAVLPEFADVSGLHPDRPGCSAAVRQCQLCCSGHQSSQLSRSGCDALRAFKCQVQSNSLFYSFYFIFFKVEELSGHCWKRWFQNNNRCSFVIFVLYLPISIPYDCLEEFCLFLFFCCCCCCFF